MRGKGEKRSARLQAFSMGEQWFSSQGKSSFKRFTEKQRRQSIEAHTMITLRLRYASNFLN